MCKHNHLKCYWSVYKWQPTAPVVQRTTIGSAARRSSDISSCEPRKAATQHLIPVQPCIMSNVTLPGFKEFVARSVPDWQEHPGPGPLGTDAVAAHSRQPNMGDIPAEYALECVTSPAEDPNRIVWLNGKAATRDGTPVWRCNLCLLPPSEYLPCCIVTARPNLTGLS
jgi:hypothetical protein